MGSTKRAIDIRMAYETLGTDISAVLYMRSQAVIKLANFVESQIDLLKSIYNCQWKHWW